MKRCFVIFLFCAVILTACTPHSIPPYTQPSLAEELVPSAAPPDATDTPASLYPEEGWWRLPGQTPMTTSVGATGKDYYANPEDYYPPDKLWFHPVSTYEGGKMTLVLEGLVDLNEPIACAFVLLVDGIPTPFRVNDETDEVYMVPLLIGKERTETEISFTPTFSREIGRIDVVYQFNPMKPSDDPKWILTTYVKNLSVPSEEAAAQNPYSAQPEQSGAKSGYGCLQPKDDPYATRATSRLKISLSDEGNEWWYWENGNSTKAKRSRTIFFVDYEPYPVYNGECYVDWNGAENMDLMIPITFENIDHPSIFFAVTIPMDDPEFRYNTYSSLFILLNP